MTNRVSSNFFLFVVNNINTFQLWSTKNKAKVLSVYTGPKYTGLYINFPKKFQLNRTFFGEMSKKCNLPNKRNAKEIKI